jgi:hypothetical protein
MTADENADLKRRVSELEAKLAPPQSAAQREKEDREYMSKVHAMRERQMNFASPPLTRDEVKAMNEACPPSAVQDIVAHGSIQGPTGMAPTSSQVGAVHTSPGIAGSGTGWVSPRTLGPQPGIDHIDRLMDEQDRRDKAELKQKLATGQ